MIQRQTKEVRKNLIANFLEEKQHTNVCTNKVKEKIQ